MLTDPAKKPRTAAIGVVVETINQEFMGRAQCQAFLRVSAFVSK